MDVRKRIIDLMASKLCSTRHTQSLCPEVADEILKCLKLPKKKETNVTLVGLSREAYKNIGFNKAVDETARINGLVI